MKTDGLTPIAFADQDGWPAMGTFDILNLRLNGYDFHVGLMAGKEKWTDPKVTAVFQKWAEILPYHSTRLRRQEMDRRRDHARSRRSRACSCSGSSCRASSRRRRSRPTSTTSTSSPIPPWGRSTTPRPRSTRRSTPGRSPPSHRTSQRRRTTPWPTSSSGRKGSTQVIFFQHQPGVIPTAKDADTSKYTPLQKKAVEVVGNAKRITQFLDRDTRSGLRRAAGHAGLPPEVPCQPDPGHGRVPEEHPGLLGPAAAAHLSRSINLTPCQVQPPPTPPCPVPHRVGRSPSAAPRGASSRS